MYSDLSLSIKEKEDKKNSFYLSVAIHLILLLLLLMIPMKKAMTHKEELQGILVDFGNPNAGQENNITEPVMADSSQEEKEEAAANEETAKEKAPAAKVTPAKIETELVQEKSEVIAEKEVILEKQTKKVESAKVVENISASESISSESEATEQERAAEIAAAKAEEKKLAESKAKFGSLFGGGATGSENDKKGDEFGVPDASALEGLSKGTGEAGEGLDSRGLVYEPKIEDNSQKSGKVVVKVCVNKQGNVVSAKYTQRGSSTTDNYLIDLAERSAKKYRFTPSNVDEQCGIIAIDFIVK